MPVPDRPPSVAACSAGQTEPANLYADAILALPDEVPRRPVALIGFMGIGKTTVGRALASYLGWEFLDTDQAIEARCNMTIREIFDWFGEPRFRELEQEVIASETTAPGRVLALGGGAFVQPANRALLLERCTVVYLASPWAHMERSIHRLSHTRPLLRNRKPADLERLFETRQASYQLAHARVGVVGRSPAQVAQRIGNLLGLPNKAEVTAPPAGSTIFSVGLPLAE